VLNIPDKYGTLIDMSLYLISPLTPSILQDKQLSYVNVAQNDAIFVYFIVVMLIVYYFHVTPGN